MPSLYILIDLVLKFFVLCLQGPDELFDFQGVYIFVVGICVNEQRGL